MIDYGVLITGGVGILTTTISALVSWILTKRKYCAEVDSNLISNMSSSLEFYKSLADDNKKRLDAMQTRNEALEHEVADLRKQVLTMMGSMCYNLSCQHRQLDETINGTKIKKKVQGK